MQPEFWHERWRRNQIGFHQGQANSFLERYFPLLGLRDGNEVFVPLCGKSVDMVRLHEEGAQILGVELSDIAVESFFTDNGIPVLKEPDGPFIAFTADGYRIYAGNYFKLDRARLARARAVYDRAALIALPLAMRPAYASHMATLVASGTPMLLLTHEYPQHEMPGPPFAVSEAEVHTLFDASFTIGALEQRDVLAQNPQFRNRGLSAFSEHAYILTRR